MFHYSLCCYVMIGLFFFFFQAEDGIRDRTVTGVQTCALPIFSNAPVSGAPSYFAALYTSNNAAGFANYRLSATDNGAGTARSEERRVGKECRARWAAAH